MLCHTHGPSHWKPRFEDRRPQTSTPLLKRAGPRKVEEIPRIAPGEKTRIAGRSLSWPQPYALLCAPILQGSAIYPLERTALCVGHFFSKSELIPVQSGIPCHTPHVPLLVLCQIRRLHHKSRFVTSSPQQTYPMYGNSGGGLKNNEGKGRSERVKKTRCRESNQRVVWIGRIYFRWGDRTELHGPQRKALGGLREAP